MKKEIMMLGLVGLLGCDKRNVSTVSQNVYLTRPEGCEIEKDIRFSESTRGYCRYQVLCGNSKDDTLTLYDRSCSAEAWRKIELK